MPKRRTASSTLAVDLERHALARAAVGRVCEVTGQKYTIRQFTREAVDRKLREIWDDYNDGQPVPPDYEPLPTHPNISAPRSSRRAGATPA